MKSIESRTALLVVLLSVLLLAGCTATPEKYTNKAPLLFTQTNAMPTVIDAAKAQAVASAEIGVPQVFTDPQFGRRVELVVEAEYFSANGRTCRRYAEFARGQTVPGVSCQDKAQGWIDIPLNAFVR